MDNPAEFLDEFLDRVIDLDPRGRQSALEEVARERPELRVELEGILRSLGCLSVGRSTPEIRGVEVGELLGRGGMAAVYRCTVGGSEARALKVLEPRPGVAEAMRRRFRSEAGSLAAIDHPHVVRVLSVHTDEGLDAFTMTLVEGPSLARLIEAWRVASTSVGESRSRTLARLVPGADGLEPERFLLRAGLSIARALETVHGGGFLHRDVKPSNVLIGREGHPYLADFGVARDSAGIAATEAGAFLGTAGYAAPEQVRGERGIGPGVDLFGLGATLVDGFEVCRPPRGDGALGPAPGERDVALRRIHRRDPRLARVLEHALEPDPELRYSAASEMAVDFERLLRGEAPLTARPSPAVALRRLRRRHGTLARALGGGLVLGLVVAIVVLVIQLWLPTQVEERLRRARIELLSSTFSEAALAGFAEGGLEESRPVIRDEDVEERYRRALAHYRFVVRWGRGNGAAQGEFEAVERALHMIQRVQAAEGDAVSGRIPGAWTLQRGLPRFDRGIRPPIDSGERRVLGLTAYLVGDGWTATRMWEGTEADDAKDPLARACLGQVYLLTGRASWAWARLESVLPYFGFPGFLCTAAADSALRSGDLDRAGALLDLGSGAPDPCPFRSHLTVRGDLAALQGHSSRALETYARHAARHPAVRTRRHLAALLGSLGRWEQAYAALPPASPSYPSSRASAERRALVTRHLSTLVEPDRVDALVLAFGGGLEGIRLTLSERPTQGSEPVRDGVRDRILESMNQRLGTSSPGLHGHDPLGGLALRTLMSLQEPIRMHVSKPLARVLIASAVQLDRGFRAVSQARMLARATEPGLRPALGVGLAIAGILLPVEFANAQSVLHKIDGEVLGGNAGNTVVRLGDIDGDGVPEIGYQSSVVGTGEFRVVSGMDPTTVLWTAPTPGSNFATVEDQFGSSAVATEDLDLDGIPDVLVGADQYPSFGTGYVILLSGASGDPIPGMQFFGAAPGDQLGVFVESGGDVTGDGVGDHILGASQFHGTGSPLSGSGYAWVISGSTGQQLHTLSPTAQSGARTGNARFVGDLNGDQVREVLMSATHIDIGGIQSRGRAWVYDGSSLQDGGSPLVLATIDDPNGLKSLSFGDSLVGTSDLNGNGVDDFVIGERGWSGTPGELHAFDGSTFQSLWSEIGPQNGSTFSWGLDAVSDVDGDNVGDLVVGIPFSTSALKEVGSISIRSGATGSEIWGLSLGGSGDRVGRRVATLGDLDGDGHPEFATGAIRTDPSPVLGDAGRVYIISTACLSPNPYGIAKTNSKGCVPAIGSVGSTSLSDPAPFLITGDQVLNNKAGLLFWGTCEESLPFAGGHILVGGPVKRTMIQSTGGNPPPNDCSGTLQFDFKALALSGAEPSLTLHRTVFAQYWYRDQASLSGIGLTDGLRFTLCP